MGIVLWHSHILHFVHCVLKQAEDFMGLPLKMTKEKGIEVFCQRCPQAWEVGGTESGQGVGTERAGK